MKYLLLVLLFSISFQSFSVDKKCKKNETLFEGRCVRMPTNAEPLDKPPGWRCKYGYTIAHFNCKKVSVPKHASLNEDGISWSCHQGYKPYRGTCVKD